MESEIEKVVVDNAQETVGTAPRKSYKVEGTYRQKKAIAILAKEGGPVSTAMVKAGYSPESARNPHVLTKSKSYQQLMKKYLPDTHLLKKHREFLDAPRIKRTYVKGVVVDETIETDPSSVKALDMAYKLTGKYAPEGGNTTNVLIVQLSDTAAARYKTAEPQSS